MPVSGDPDDDAWDDLHAWIDGQLPSSGLARLGQTLARDPQEAMRAMAYQAQVQGLHALYDPILEEAVPPRLLVALEAGRPRSAPSPWTLWATAAVAGLSLLLCLSQFMVGAVAEPVLAADESP
ncbi:anti-sigma factor family protein [Oleisolibacter albus]|uniref:anti-sigma factor family protein n=1 Tax=Oleisolibacter albus TaxID=2171757 RepID=UPI000DF44B6A|nr:hypothetical protein [Oleisolibacter albus]